jgi:hypothetical protein
MLRRILGSKKENISGWSKQFIDLHNMYFSPDILMVIMYEGGWDGQNMLHCLSDKGSWTRIPSGYCIHEGFLVLVFRVGRSLETVLHPRSPYRLSTK